MNQRAFLNLYVGTALLLSSACVTISINSIKMREALPPSGEVPIISVEKDRTLITVAPKTTDREVLERHALTAIHLCPVPKCIFFELIGRESSWNPGSVSSSGAIGLGQVKPSTGREFQLDVYDISQNVLAGACYLRKQFDTSTAKDEKDAWREALYSYHAGPNRERTSQETINYADDILRKCEQ